MLCLDRRWACVSYSACNRMLRAHSCSFHRAAREWLFMQIFIHMQTSHTHHSADIHPTRRVLRLTHISCLVQESTRNTAKSLPLWSCGVYKMTVNSQTPHTAISSLYQLHQFIGFRCWQFGEWVKNVRPSKWKARRLSFWRSLKFMLIINKNYLSALFF